MEPVDQQRPLRIATHTLGCRLNQVDTESLRARLAESFAVTFVAWDDDADLYVVNGCTVTAHADRECRRLARQAKHRHPQSRVVVVGCGAQAQPQAFAGVAEIDGVVGTADRDDVTRWLPRVLAGERVIATSGDFVIDEAPTAAAGQSRAFVKIQDGCDLRCAYCLVWQARGPARSRAAADVIDQLAALRAAGCREAVLGGVHLGAWGRDHHRSATAPDTLPGLLAAIGAAVPGLRLRLGSLHPDELTPALVDVMAGHPRIRPHLHVSLQSGSDQVLARMRRPYRRVEATGAITSAAAALPSLGLGADLIVGFPGETDADFALTCDLVAGLPFTYLHVFRFSPRPGTVAATLPDPVAPEAVTERAAHLRKVGAQKCQAFLTALIGKPREAIVERGRDPAHPGWRLATADNFATVMVPEAFVPGSLVEVVPARADAGRLWAEELKVLPEEMA